MDMTTGVRIPGYESGVRSLASSFTCDRSSQLTSTPSFCQSFLSQSFLSCGDNESVSGGGRKSCQQQMTQKDVPSRKRSSSLAVSLTQSLLPATWETRRGSMQPDLILGFAATNSSLQATFTFGSTSSAGSGTTFGGSAQQQQQQADDKDNTDRDRMEKECKQVFFDCAM